MGKGRCSTAQCRTNNLLHQQIGNSGQEENNCPTITLLDLAWPVNPWFDFGVPANVTLGANFSESISAGLPPATLTMAPVSGFTLTYFAARNVWRFNYDGTPVAGFYPIAVNGTDANGCAITQRIYNVEVQAPAAPVADFSATPTTLPIPGEKTQFTDLSSNTPTSWLWEYSVTGLNTWTTFSTSQNPKSAIGGIPGIYDIRLTATNAIGSDSETKTAYITILP